ATGCEAIDREVAVGVAQARLGVEAPAYPAALARAVGTGALGDALGRDERVVDRRTALVEYLAADDPIARLDDQLDVDLRVGGDRDELALLVVVAAAGAAQALAPAIGRGLDPHLAGAHVLEHEVALIIAARLGLGPATEQAGDDLHVGLPDAALVDDASADRAVGRQLDA